MFHPQLILTLLLTLPIMLWGQSATFKGKTYLPQTMSDGTRTVTYHLAGFDSLANPRLDFHPDSQRVYACAYNSGPKISRATLHQLLHDRVLYEAVVEAINANLIGFGYPIPENNPSDPISVCCVNKELIFGTKYYQQCYERSFSADPKTCYRAYPRPVRNRDLQLKPVSPNDAIRISYQILVNLNTKTIYIAEINGVDGSVKEINTCNVMSQGFESDQESWELNGGEPLDNCIAEVRCEVNKTESDVNDPFIFTASLDKDLIEDAKYSTYEWSYSNNTIDNGRSVTRAFSSPGTYTATITHTDPLGNVSQAECPVVTVGIPADTTLTPVCEVTPIAGPLNTNFCFSAGKSTILPEGASIASYRWDFEDNAYADGDTAFHIFAEAGTYNVRLTITDERGVTASTVCPVEVDSNAERKYPPIALFEPDPREACKGDAISFDAELSHDQDELDIDPKGHEVVSYAWDFGDGEEGTGVYTIHKYPYVGEYEVALTVTDNEGQQNLTTRLVNIRECGDIPPPPPPPTTRCDTTIVICPPCNQDSCMHPIYTVRSCEGRLDTMGTTFMRVICPAPERPTVIYIGECQQADDPADDSPLQLAGGTAFRIWRGQITEYGLGVNAQIRYRLGEKRRWAVFADLGVTPIRKALPLDDRPYKWSPLRDSIDVATGLPLVWWRGTNRGTANAGLGFEFAPWKWMYIQAMGGFERSFNQREVSDPRKSDENMFIGYRQNVLYVEPRIAVRKDHMEIFYSVQFLQENRPFVFIPANNIGGSHNEITDKTHNFGVLLYF